MTRAESLRFLLLRALAENPACTQRELAGTLGISLGRVNYCLQTLLRSGFTEAGFSRTAGRKTRMVYQLTPEGLSERQSLAGRYLDFKLQEFEHLTVEIANLRGETS